MPCYNGFMQITSQSLADTKAVAISFLASLSAQESATVVALHGDLGAGKTAFTKIVAELLEVSMEVTSPTFVIEKVYEINQSQKNQIQHFPFVRLIHIDAYRLESAQEITSLGWEEKIADPSNLIFVEWPQNINEVLPSHTHHIYFTFIDEATRTIEIKN